MTVKPVPMATRARREKRRPAPLRDMTLGRRRFFRVGLVGLFFFPLSAGASGPELVPRADNKTFAQWSEPATLRWNLVARALVRKNLVDPL